MEIMIKFKKEIKNKNIEILKNKKFNIYENSFGYICIQFRHLYFDEERLVLENKEYKQITLYLSEFEDFEIQ